MKTRLCRCLYVGVGLMIDGLLWTQELESSNDGCESKRKKRNELVLANG